MLQFFLQHWEVFETVSELFIMVPALLGLKGNLEMTLASRLSTNANLGHLDDKSRRLSLLIGNLALIQVILLNTSFRIFYSEKISSFNRYRRHFYKNHCILVYYIDFHKCDFRLII